jgi:hypothetical protein
MAFHVRRGSGAVLPALVAAVNALRPAMAAAGQHFHADITSVAGGDFTAPISVPAEITAPRATDLPTLLRLCADVGGKLSVHFRDALAHRTADTASALASGPPLDLTQAQAFLNDCKAKWNAHLTRAGVHYTNDAPNAIGAPDATNLQTAMDLANTIRAVLTPHITSAPAGAAIVLTEP